jgi:hypothetical protein
MGFVTDLRAIGALLVVQLVGFLAGLMALLGPVLAVLPIPKNPHEWGVALASAALYLKVRHRERKRRAARRKAAPVAAPPDVWPGPAAAKRRARPAAEKTAKVKKPKPVK